MTFEDWMRVQDPSLIQDEFSAAAGWNAGKYWERERLQPVIDALQECDEAMEYMSEYDIPLGLPLRVSEALKIAKGEPQ